MDFGDAIRALKAGKCVTRPGWNGKGMHIYLEDRFCRPGLEFNDERQRERWYDPAICMFTTNQTHQPGWLASQADMLAEDWEIVGR